MSEFGWVRVSLGTTGRGPRLKVEDVDSDAVIVLDAIELASMCHASEAQRAAWLRTGHYATGDVPGKPASPPDDTAPDDTAPDHIAPDQITAGDVTAVQGI